MSASPQHQVRGLAVDRTPFFGPPVMRGLVACRFSSGVRIRLFADCCPGNFSCTHPCTHAVRICGITDTHDPYG
jgi:hypothetical protein